MPALRYPGNALELSLVGKRQELVDVVFHAYDTEWCYTEYDNFFISIFVSNCDVLHSFF